MAHPRRSSSSVRDMMLPGAAQPEDITETLIKQVSCKFDVEIVFKLNLHGRGIKSMSGLSCCCNLIELNLDNNNIQRLDGLDNLTNLRRLSLASNSLEHLNGVGALSSLQTLCLQGNKIACVDALCLDQLALLKGLSSLYVQSIDRSLTNPVCNKQNYKGDVLGALPGLYNLDGERNPHQMHYIGVLAEMQEESKYEPPDWSQYEPKLVPFLNSGGGDLPSAASDEMVDLDNKMKEFSEAFEHCVDLHERLDHHIHAARAQLLT